MTYYYEGRKVLTVKEMRKGTWEVRAWKGPSGGYAGIPETSVFHSAEEALEDLIALKRFMNMGLYQRAVVVGPRGDVIAEVGK